MTLRELRNSKGLRLNYVAKQIGVSETTLWRWESEPRRIKWTAVSKLLKVYNISYEELDKIMSA